MLIRWNKKNLKYIPNSGTGIKLLPGVNDVPDTEWKEVRVNVLDQIKSKEIEELHCEIVEDEKKGPGGRVAKIDYLIQAKSLGEISAPQAEKIVEETFNLDTLKAWKEKESRDSVRSKINNKIEEIMNYKGAVKK